MFRTPAGSHYDKLQPMNGARGRGMFLPSCSSCRTVAGVLVLVACVVPGRAGQAVLPLYRRGSLLDADPGRSARNVL